MATEIENLRARTETLNQELTEEERKEKSLQQDVEILEEKIVIRNLENDLYAKRESVRQLEMKKRKLEDEYNQPPQETKTEAEPEASPQIIVAPEAVCSDEISTPEEQEAEKKHRFF